MAQRTVKRSRKLDGDITHLCGDWGDSPVAKNLVRKQIEGRIHVYEVGGSVVEVVKDPTVADGFYLRSRKDGSTKNNLDELPDC